MNISERPWIILNAAMTADGKIDTTARQGAKISSNSDWERVDRLRAEVDAVMVGGHTLLNEDPRLTVKSPVLRQERTLNNRPENPIKVGIISNASIDPQGKFMQSGSSQVLVFTTRQTSQDQVEKLRQAGADLFLSESSRVDLREAMRTLRINRVERVNCRQL